MSALSRRRRSSSSNTSSSLWRAVAEGRSDDLAALLAKQHSSSFDINLANDASGQTLLHAAVIANQPACVALLLDQLFIDLHRRDAALGWTPLHHALFMKHHHVALLLAARGGPHLLYALDHQGFSPADLALAPSYPPPPSATQPRHGAKQDQEDQGDDGDDDEEEEMSNGSDGRGDPHHDEQDEEVALVEEGEEEVETSAITTTTGTTTTGTSARAQGGGALGELFSWYTLPPTCPPSPPPAS